MDSYGWIILIVSIAASAVIPSVLNRLRRKREQQPPEKQERQPFLPFLFDKTDSNPTVSIDEVVEAYIREYSLAACHHPDEPSVLTMNRAKLQVLEEFVRQYPNYNKEDANFRTYLTGLRTLVPTLDQLPPDVLRQMKERETDRQPPRDAEPSS